MGINWTRTCKVAGQGITEGNVYTITGFWWEVYGPDMISTYATVVGEDGVSVEIKNAHIAFDLVDVIDDLVSA
jgi:hypothetical protein